MDNWTQDYFDDIYRCLFLETIDPARTQRQVQQLLALCPSLPGSVVLDIGCGLGRHSLVLAGMGFHVLGVDMNPDYIDTCREHAAEASVHARFVAADARTMDLGMQADLIISLWSSFGYYGEEGDAMVLERIAAHTKPHGHVLIDVENRDYIVRHFVPEEWHEVGERTVLERRRFDALRGTVLTRRLVLGADGRREYRRELRMYTASELRDQLSRVGLTVTGVFGDYDGSRFGVESKRMITVAER